MAYTTLEFTRSPGGTFASYWAADKSAGARYTIEEYGDGRNRYHLTYVDDNDVNENGNTPVVQLGRYATVTDAAREARSHLDGLREDRAQATVLTHVHPADGSVLNVFTNGYTRITEVILNDQDGTARLVLDRDQVQALVEALGSVVEVQNAVRSA